jgi:hypothetical protein
MRALAVDPGGREYRRDAQRTLRRERRRHARKHAEVVREPGDRRHRQKTAGAGQRNAGGIDVGRRSTVGRRLWRRKIHQNDPKTGNIMRTIEAARFVTGVTFVDGELWHATWESDESELRQIDAISGEVLQSQLTSLPIPISARRNNDRSRRRAARAVSRDARPNYFGKSLADGHCA